MPVVAAPHGPIEYESEGSGTPIVLINGLGSQLIRWPVRFRETLVERGFRVIRFDNRDAGLSYHYPEASTPNLRELAASLRNGDRPALPYSLNDLARDVSVLLDALELPSAHIVGMSMGGFIGQLLALNAPQRVRSLTLLMTSSGNPDLPAPSPKAQALLQRRSAPIVDRDALIESGLINQQAIASPGYPADLSEVRTRVAAEIDRAYDPGGYLRQRAAIMADGDRRDRIRAIDRPTLVLHGEDDPLINVAAGRELAQLIPGAILATYPGMAHEIPAGLATRVADDIAAFARWIEPC